MRIYNLRGYARYLYGAGQIEIGRQLYGEAVRTETKDSDIDRYTKADTYLLWAKAEEQFGYQDEARRALAHARS